MNNIYFPQDNMNIFVIIYTISFSILIGVIFSRRKEIANKEKLEIANLLGGTIAHEMRTVLLTIRSYSWGLNELLPKLINTYHIASLNRLITEYIPNEQFNTLKKITTNIDTTVKKANSFIDLLLVNIKGLNDSYNNSYFSISECIIEAINDYPMSEEERDYFDIKLSQHFIIYGNKEVIIHIIFNLISNSIYYFSSISDPKITIQSKLDGDFNYIYFRDNGPGVNKNDINLIFNKFYSKTKRGSGLGLSFCKMSMITIKGDITCKSVEGHYAEFILKFPKCTIGE